MKQLLFLVCLVIVEIFADFSLEKYANYMGGTEHLMAGIMGYMGVIFFLLKSLAGSSILVVNALWDGISSIMGSGAAMLFLGQRLENIPQYIGLLLTIVGLVLLKYKKAPATKS